MNKGRSKRGFTLIEVLLTVALLTVVISPIYMLISTQYKGTLREQYKMEQVQDMKLILRLIEMDLRKYEVENSVYDNKGELVKLALGEKLYINEKANYYTTDGKLMRGTTELCSKVKSFSAVEISDGLDSNVIKIDLTISAGTESIKVKELDMHYSYRRKLPKVR